MSDSASWDWDMVDAIARRVLELIDERRDEEVTRSSLLTVGQVAARLGVGAKWVYAHQHELGVVKLGRGPKARLRFSAGVVGQRLAASPLAKRELDRVDRRSSAAATRRRRRLESRPIPLSDRGPERA